jgi:hypothetical protein
LFAVPHPKFRFGGSEGSTVSTVAFRRTDVSGVVPVAAAAAAAAAAPDEAPATL